MLRSSAKIPIVLVLSKNTVNSQKRRFSAVTSCLHAKHAFASVSRQSKIMNKLFGARIAGSKKRWVPTNDSQTDQSVVFKASQFGRPAGAGTGKSTTRRMAVLNKLFMKHITDLLATGEASESIVGRGMQVTRLKITQDFALINVYWLGNGVPLEDEQLETDLNACAGYIRHELSQLCLMGEVPRIKFVRDKKSANINEVECLLKNIDFDKVEDDNEDDYKSQTYDVAQTMKNEFYGKNNSQPAGGIPSVGASEAFPLMRHDVLGLDQQAIMIKILTKMRKSKQAWDAHYQGTPSTQEASREVSNDTALQRVSEKLSLAITEDSKFDEYLAKRRDRKDTPDRKKYRRSDEWLPEDELNQPDEDLIFTRQQHQLNQLNDYIEEYENDKKLR